MSSLPVNSRKASSMAFTVVSAGILPSLLGHILTLPDLQLYLKHHLLSVTTKKLLFFLRSTLPTPARRKPVTVSCNQHRSEASILQDNSF